MSECNRLWEAICRVQDETDRASVGGVFPREPMPISMLFAELDRSMARRFRYRTFSSAFDMPTSKP